MQATTQALAKGFSEARGQLGGFAKQLGGVGSLIAGVFAGSGLAALQHFAGLADDLSDNVERLEVMFGGATDSIVAQAEKMNEAFGTSEITYTAAATKLGGMFKAQGIGADASANMTNQLLTLTQAVANFKGIGFAEALTKVQAGMAGRGRGLKELGITVTATMTAQQRFNAIMSGGASIIGAMDQRAQDAGNAWAEFKGRIEQVEIEIGKNLPEMVEPFFRELNTAVVAAIQYWKDLRQTTFDWGDATATSAKTAVESMGWVQKSIGFIADAWSTVRLAFQVVQTYITATLGSIIQQLSWLSEQFNKFFHTDAGTSTTNFLKTWSEDLDHLSDVQWEGFQKKLAEPWPSDSVNKYFDNARAKIQEARKEVAGSAFGAHVFAPPKAGKGHPFAEAMQAGSKESASAILRSKFQIGGDKEMAKVAANSDKQVALLQNIADNLGDMGGDIETVGAF